MTQTVMNVSGEILWIAGGALVLFLFALAVAWPHRSSTPPGSSGHRPSEEESESEVIRADGYIDSFSEEIEEAGGGLPLVVKLALPGILLWWLGYMILFWKPR
jgi:hypothetical protein